MECLFCGIHRQCCVSTPTPTPAAGIQRELASEHGGSTKTISWRLRWLMYRMKTGSGLHFLWRAVLRCGVSCTGTCRPPICTLSQWYNCGGPDTPPPKPPEVPSLPLELRDCAYCSSLPEIVSSTRLLALVFRWKEPSLSRCTVTAHFLSLNYLLNLDCVWFSIHSFIQLSHRFGREGFSTSTSLLALNINEFSLSPWCKMVMNINIQLSIKMFTYQMKMLLPCSSRGCTKERVREKLKSLQQRATGKNA